MAFKLVLLLDMDASAKVFKMFLFRIRDEDRYQIRS